MTSVIQKDLLPFISSGNIQNIKSRVRPGVQFPIVSPTKTPINSSNKYINRYFQNSDADWPIQFISGPCKGSDP